MKLFVETDADSRLAKRVLKVRKSSQFIRLQNLSSMCVMYHICLSQYVIRNPVPMASRFCGERQCCGSSRFIPDPGSDFCPSRVSDPGYVFLTVYLIFIFFPHIYKVFTIDSYSNIRRTALELLGARF
jgi:hypothetical protein